MANIKDLKDTESYINRLKKAVVELVSMNDFSLFIYVNDTPIDEFFRNLETLNPEDAINALRDGLSKLNFETTGINVKENGELTTEYIDKSFINGIHEYTSDAYGESYNMADEARKGLSNAISKVNDILNDGRTNQPTIRPVLDLTDIESGAGRINGLFKNVNVGGNLNAITVGMRSKGQNGTANDVVSAINKLGSNIGSGGDTYNINGITYDDQSSVAEAIQVLIRAANIERRS